MYAKTYFFVKLWSKLEAAALEMIPKPAKFQIPWQGLTDIRLSLVERDMIKEAISIFGIEINRTPLVARPDKIVEVLATLASFPNLRGQSLMVANLKYVYAENSIDLHNLSLAKKIVAESESALDQWCIENDIESKANLPLNLKLQYTRLHFISDIAEKLTAAEALLQPMERSCYLWLLALWNWLLKQPSRLLQ